MAARLEGFSMAEEREHRPPGGATIGDVSAEGWQHAVDLRRDVLVTREPVDGIRRFSLSDAPASHDLVHGKPWNTPVRPHGQRNRTGEYYFATTRHHVQFASLEEQTLLLSLDHEQTVTAVLAHPFQLIFERNGQKESHIPDSLVVRVNGDQQVWDVRPRDGIDGKLTRKAALTREFCRAAGFQYLLFDGLSRVTNHTLTFLHAYSDPRRYRPTPDAEDKLLAHFSPRSTLRRALECIDQPPRQIRMWVYHLLWTRAITMDLHRPLSDHRTIWTAS